MLSETGSHSVGRTRQPSLNGIASSVERRIRRRDCGRAHRRMAALADSAPSCSVTPHYDLSRFDAERDLKKIRASAFADAFEADKPLGRERRGSRGDHRQQAELTAL